MLNFLKYLILLIISPAKGWEDIAESDVTPRMAYGRGLLPLTAVGGLSAFAPLIYGKSTTWQCITDALVIIGSYFITYFIAIFVYQTFAGRWVQERKADIKRFSLFISYNLAILLVCVMLRNVIPVENALINFLPVFDILIMWKGAQFIYADEDYVGHLMLLSIVSIMVPPLAIDWLLNLII